MKTIFFLFKLKQDLKEPGEEESRFDMIAPTIVSPKSSTLNGTNVISAEVRNIALTYWNIVIRRLQNTEVYKIYKSQNLQFVKSIGLSGNED